MTDAESGRYLSAVQAPGRAVNMAGSSIPLQKSTSSGPMDGETLAFLSKGLTPSIAAGVSQGIAKKFAALRLCLIQQEQLLASSPNFEGKEAIVRHMMVARTLCEHIQKDMGNNSNNVAPRAGSPGRMP